MSSTPPPDDRAAAVLLRGGAVFDGHRVAGRMDILLDDGRVAALGRGLPVNQDTTVLDCRGHTVTPGLIDAHVHLAWAGVEPPPKDELESRARATRNAALLLEAGVTTVRDTGGPLEVLDALAHDICEGRLTGPDLLHCGRILCAPGGHGTEAATPVAIAAECAGPEGFRQGVREQVAGGARCVKVALNGADGVVQLTRDELLAVIDEAHAARRPVACHASVRPAVALAVQCGVDTVEHGNGLDVGLALHMAANGIALIPTLAIFAELKAQLDRSDGGLLSAEQVTAHRRAVTQRLREHPPTINAALEAGVTVGLGTDRVPGGHVVAVQAEARALHLHGLTTTQVLSAATAGSARALGLDDRGTIRVGARADIAVFRGDVGADLDHLRAPTWVIKQGELVAGHGPRP